MSHPPAGCKRLTRLRQVPGPCRDCLFPAPAPSNSRDPTRIDASATRNFLRNPFTRVPTGPKPILGKNNATRTPKHSFHCGVYAIPPKRLLHISAFYSHVAWGSNNKQQVRNATSGIAITSSRSTLTVAQRPSALRRYMGCCHVQHPLKSFQLPRLSYQLCFGSSPCFDWN